MGQKNGERDMDLDGDLYGAGSKLSDDSGIEDTWNDDAGPILNNENAEPSIESDTKDRNGMASENSAEPSFAFARFTSLTPTEGIWEAPPAPCIYPQLPSHYSLPEKKQDVRDADAVPGVCGIENLGNTCFMNAGLQCLFSTPILQNLIKERHSLGSVSNGENSQSMLTFVDRFHEIFRKVLSGEYRSLYPSEFHKALSHVHPLFTDYKQHDCQEFLSFILNGLHDAINKRLTWSKRSRGSSSESDCSNPNGGSTPPMSDLKLDAPESDNDEDFGEERKRMKMDNFDNEPDVGVECDENVSDAERHWRIYLRENQSVIVDTFQGQFKSMVTCDKCHFVSVTYEPFMYMSVPIPHANERQIVVNWVPSQKHLISRSDVRAKRYLVTVSKNGCVKDIKNNLLKLLHHDDHAIKATDIVVAEVSKSVINRTLDDRMQIQYVNDKIKDIYAIELNSPIGNRFYSDNAAVSIATTLSGEKSNENYNWTENCKEQCLNNSSKMAKSENEKSGPSKNVKLSDDERPLVGCSSKEECIVDDGATGWHSCSICLEDTFDDDLLVHSICGGMMCRGCLKATSVFHGNQSFPCPVCNNIVNPDDYQNVSKSKETEVKIRNIMVPLLMRHSVKKDIKMISAKQEFCLIGHPTVILTPSQVTPNEIRQRIAEIVKDIAITSEYDIHITDSQGISCSRCDTFSSCFGCAIDSDEIVTLKPGDHLTVHLKEISADVIDQLSMVIEDNSMANIRTTDTIQLDECFQSFSEIETLSEDNPWFCPKCKRNQVAIKTMTVSRWPDILIVHLKRFHFEGLRSCKVTSPIDFPEDVLNLESVCSTENLNKDDYIFELSACVFHSGNLTGGHYTSYCRSTHDGQWYYFNDESATLESPPNLRCEKVYVLFYRKKGLSGNPTNSGE